MDRREHAAELIALSQRGFEVYRQRYFVGGEDQTWLEFIAEETASRLRNGVVHDAHHGKDRRGLLEAWVRIAAIPNHSFRDDARSMVEQYRRLIEEDERWR